jgi:hypothetical protein
MRYVDLPSFRPISFPNRIAIDTSGCEPMIQSF